MASGLRLSSPGRAAALGSPSTATLSIVDALGAVRFASPTSSAKEGSAALVGLERVGGARGAVNVTYSTANGTASSGDYTPTSNVIWWSNGDVGAKAFGVQTTEDGPANEPDETVLLSITGNVTAPSTATLAIEHRAGTLVFAAPRFGVNEFHPSIPVPVMRVGGCRGNVSVRCATSNGSAVVGVDYTAVTPTLSWSNGDASDKRCTVPILNDGASLDGDETFDLLLSAPTGGATVGSPGAATVTIMDSQGRIRFAR